MQINRANDYQLETQFAKEGDYNGRELVVQITNGGAVSSQTGVSLNLGWHHDDAGNSGLDPFTVVDVSKGIFKITYPTEMLIAGNVTATIQVIENGKITLTRNFKITVEKKPIDEDVVVSENSFTALQEALVKVNDLEDNYAPRLNEVTEQLSQTAEGVNEKSVNVLSLGALGQNVSDDTPFIQQAFNKAASYKVQSNAVGGTNFYTGNGTVKIPAGIYGISSTISVPYGVSIDMTDAVFVAIPANKTINAFNMFGNAFRNNVMGGTFVGFNTALTVSTNNRNTSRLLIDGITTHNCNVGIDTVSFASFRSTNLTVKNFQSIGTDQFIRAYSDMVHLTDGWIDHTGYNGAAIYNQGYMKIDNTIFVPAVTKPGARPRWIDNYNTSEIQPGERGLSIDHCRFGGEAGSCPIVFNFASADLELVGGYCASIIDIESTTIFSSGASYGDMAAIVLFAIPNRISIKNSSGLSNLTKGMITCDPSFNSTTIATSRLISINLDSTNKGATNYPLMDEDLHRFLMTDDTPFNAYRQTFKDGKFFRRYIAVSDDNTTAKVTFKLKSLMSLANGADQRNNGFSFLVNVSGSISGSFAYKTNALYLVSLTGGHDGTGIKKRLNYTLLASHNGGASNFGTQATVSSVHWGTDYTGSRDAEVSSTEENVTIVFNGGSNSSVTVLPLFGIDNYS